MASGNATLSDVNLVLKKVFVNEKPSSPLEANSYFELGNDAGSADGLLIFFKPLVTSENISSMMCQFPSQGSILYGYALGGTTKCTRMIACGWVDDFGYICYMGAGYSGSTLDNNRCVPIIAYTYKFVSTM